METPSHGQEFVLLSGNSKKGGMIDGHLRRVVMFPDDGHPDLAANVLDLTGDRRDELCCGTGARLDLHAGSVVPWGKDLCSDPESGLQRI
jgi:hypothetical protein